MIKLNIKKREKKENIETIRKEGKIPAVFYGSKIENTPITIDEVNFKRVLKEAGESSVVTLSLGDKEIDVLIHGIDYHPVTDKIRHVDFLAIDKNKKVSVNIPLEFIGESMAVKNLSGTLVKVLRDLGLEGLPKNLPQSIEIDVSLLDTLDSVILLKDVKLPEGVAFIGNPEDVVVSVSVQKEEVEEVSESVDISSIEVEKKGKADDSADGEKTDTDAGASNKNEK